MLYVFFPFYDFYVCMYVYIIECGGVEGPVHTDQIGSHDGCRPDRSRALTRRIGNEIFVLTQYLGP